MGWAGSEEDSLEEVVWKVLKNRISMTGQDGDCREN